MASSTVWNMATKRKRDPMFAASEKMMLIELVEKYFSIIENKKTDRNTIRKKNEQWQRLAMEFNAMSSIHPRDWTTLKSCWENLKKRAKQVNQHFLRTGVEPPKKVIEDPAIEKVCEERQTENLTTERIETLIDATSQAREEHTIQMNILRLQEEREKELLAQEKIKTEQEKIKLEILKIELCKLKGQ